MEKNHQVCNLNSQFCKKKYTNIFLFNFPEPVIEEIEVPHRYRPDNLNLLCDTTG